MTCTEPTQLSYFSESALKLPLDGLLLEEVPGAAAFETMRPAWEELWRNSPTATPFQTPAWLIPWSRRFGTEETFTLLLRRAGHLVGLIPFFVWARDGQRTVFPAGIGISDYLDGTFSAGEEEACAAAVLDHLARQPARWRAVELQELRTDAALLTAATPSGWRNVVEAQSLCAMLDLSGPKTLCRLPRRMKANLRNCRNRAERIGSLRIETATEATLPRLLEALSRLHNRRWRSRGQAGVLSDPALAELHADAAARFLRLGLLRLFALILDDAVIAALYGFAAHGQFYCYLSGFDPDLPRLSPGTLIFGHAIETVAAEGNTCFDFLRGEEAYKMLWGATSRRTWLRRLERD